MASGAPLRLACRLRCLRARRPSAASPQGLLYARQQHTFRTTPKATAPKPRVFPPRQRLTTATQTTPKPPSHSPSLSTQPTTTASEPPADPTPSAPNDGTVDWSSSFQGLSSTAFDAAARAILLAPLDPEDVEIKPDGIVYLPEIKYRRILNRAFGPGAWGLAPRGEMEVSPKTVSREYGLVVQGRLVSIARGEQQYFDPEGVPTASEGCKSNALMRCCKDLGVASELWDPVFIRRFMASHVRETWVEHQATKKKRKIFLRKDVPDVPYPYKVV